jgi:endonuclease/exonuclease/phosphatase family metal-dependent hydrolase
MGHSIRVMTFNIHHARGGDGKVELRRITSVIKNCKPDLIGLNEVDRFFHSRSEYMDQPSQLAEELKMNYAFAPAVKGALGDREAIVLPDGEEDRGATHGYGNAILSLFPIHSYRYIRLTAGGDAREPRILLEGKILMGERSITLYVAHLSLNPWHHRKQTKEILSVTTQCEEPHLIVGDWNMRPGSRPWRLLAEHYQDCWKEGGKGSGATFPSKRPFLRLDYIFASHHFHVKHMEVCRFLPMASDHLPTWCDLSFP